MAVELSLVRRVDWVVEPVVEVVAETKPEQEEEPSSRSTQSEASNSSTWSEAGSRTPTPYSSATRRPQFLPLTPSSPPDSQTSESHSRASRSTASDPTAA